jgi:hemolysin D
MAYPFERTLRSLSYEMGAQRVFLALLVACVGVLCAWAGLAEVPLVKVSSQARVEPHNAVYRIEPQSAGRVVRSLLNLDEEVNEGDLLIEFDTQAERIELAHGKSNAAAIEKELQIIRDEIVNKEAEAAVTGEVDQVAIREAVERERELAPRQKLAEERAALALSSPSGSISEIEKLERATDVDALASAKTAQTLAVARLRKERQVRGQTLTAQLLAWRREELRTEAQLRALQVAVNRLEYQIAKKHYRAPGTGRLVDVAELGAGAVIADGQRVGTIVATDGQLRIRARFPKEVVGLIQPEQTARLKLDGYPVTIYGTVPAKVTRVGTEPGQVLTPEAIPGTVRVELEFDRPSDSRIQLRHGMTLSVEVEVGRVSPLALLMRAMGDWKPQPPESVRRPQEFRAEAEAR